MLTSTRVQISETHKVSYWQHSKQVLRCIHVCARRVLKLLA